MKGALIKMYALGIAFEVAFSFSVTRLDGQIQIAAIVALLGLAAGYPVLFWRALQSAK